MKRTQMAVLALLVGGNAIATAPERTVSLDAARIGTIRIEGQIQTWVVDKVCIDGQAYLMVLGTGSPSAIAPSFKDGKPEQCQPKPGK